ncbi:hypothetical protein ACNKHK_18905 [Shigella flexneri]
MVAMCAVEQQIKDDTPLADVLPTIFNKYPVRYRDSRRVNCVRNARFIRQLRCEGLPEAMFRQEIARPWR